jgi:hypothetical protein
VNASVTLAGKAKEKNETSYEVVKEKSKAT